MDFVLIVLSSVLANSISVVEAARRKGEGDELMQRYVWQPDAAEVKVERGGAWAEDKRRGEIRARMTCVQARLDQKLIPPSR